MSSPQPQQDDTAALRAAYADLQQQNARLRGLMELSADWFWQKDANFRFVDLGVASGWPETLPPMGMMLGRAQWEIPGLEVQGGWQAHRQRLERHEPYRDEEVRYRSPEGRECILVLSGMPTFARDGTFTGYVGVGRDVTEPRRAQQALRESQRAMSALIANLPGMAYRCRNEPESPVEFASDGALALTGYPAEAFLRGEPHYGDLIHPDDRDRVWRGLQEAVAGHRQFQLTYRIRARDGGERWVWEQGSTVYGAGDEVVAVEGFVADVTATKLAQDEVARLNAGLEERVRERTAQLQTAHAELQSFAYAIAHDLRAPLTSIDGFSRLLARSGLARGDARVEHWLQRIGAGVHQMAVLTDALLALAQLSRVTPRPERVDLAAVARNTLDGLRSAEPERSVEIDVPAQLWAVGDRRLLQQALTHLLDNAWKFSAQKARTFIRIGSEELAGETVYFVEDRGAGFDMAHAARLFEGFQRLHRPEEFAGAGVGLTLAHKIVRLHGGRMWATAAADDGATFFFTLQPAA